MTSPLLSLDQATVTAPLRLLCESLSLEATGRLVVLLGDASPVLAPIFGQARVTAGSFKLAGDPLPSHPVPAIGLCPYAAPMPAGMTPLAYAAWSARLLGHDGSNADERARDACEIVGLEEQAKRPLGELPQTAARLTLLAHAIVAGPSVVVAEAPLYGYDGESAAFISRALASISELVPVIASAPGLLPASPAFALATRADAVVVLEGGRLVASGPPSSISLLSPDSWQKETV